MIIANPFRVEIESIIAADEEISPGVRGLKRSHDIAVFHLAPADRFLQVGRQNAEYLPVDVVDRGGEEQERANVPAQARIPASVLGCPDFHRRGRHSSHASFRVRLVVLCLPGACYRCCINRPMKIIDIRPTTVTVPLEAPLRHANGCHWGRFVRTIVEVETDNGLIGLGEMGGGGESAEAVFRAMKAYLVGHDPARLEEMRFLIANPTASLYNNRTQILAALEFACLDIIGQAWNVPVCDILGGRLRDRVPFASYCFYRYANPATGAGRSTNS